MIALHFDQEYVEDIARERGISLEMLYYFEPTSTCQEKASLLAWSAQRIIKTLYFSDGDSPFIGFVTPEFGQPVLIKRILQDQLGLSGKQAKRYQLGKRLPRGMEYGACTPFAHESSFREEIDGIIIADVPRLDDVIVDVSIGGKGDDAHMASLHLPYRGIYQILAQQFGEKIYRDR